MIRIAFRRMRANLERAAERTTHQDLFIGKVALYAAVLAALAILTAVSFSQNSRGAVAATIEADTRQFTVSWQPGDALPTWRGLNASVITDEESETPLCTSGSFTFNRISNAKSKVDVRVLVDGRGALIGSTDALTEASLSDIGQFECQGGGVMPGSFSLNIKLGESRQPWSAAFSGRLELGSLPPVNVGAQPDFERNQGVIESGKVTTEVLSIPLNSGTIRSETLLMPGDQILLRTDGARLVSPVSYIIAKRRGMSLGLVAHSAADQIELIRYGDEATQHRSLAPTLWARFRAQEEWVLLLGMFLLLRAAFGAWEGYAKSVWPVKRRSS